MPVSRAVIGGGGVEREGLGVNEEPMAHRSEQRLSYTCPHGDSPPAVVVATVVRGALREVCERPPGLDSL